MSSKQDEDAVDDAARLAYCGNVAAIESNIEFKHIVARLF
ncbi:hypothetical protein M7I_2562 [Glarea lozoyensis 74030]|uniref:Uncharacterized protein n=1 Tax=Glarea lozoyensis (strain ATCC 74030 / MF5533) TaxID=1104152 RepID=H0EJ38_GLAL7|nr:hypothetical protein M7I_2562 [Glarea lozoyensis 74030]